MDTSIWVTAFKSVKSEDSPMSFRHTNNYEYAITFQNYDVTQTHRLKWKSACNTEKIFVCIFLKPPNVLALCERSKPNKEDKFLKICFAFTLLISFYTSRHAIHCNNIKNCKQQHPLALVLKKYAFRNTGWGNVSSRWAKSTFGII